LVTAAASATHLSSPVFEALQGSVSGVLSVTHLAADVLNVSHAALASAVAFSSAVFLSAMTLSSAAFLSTAALTKAAASAASLRHF